MFAVNPRKLEQLHDVVVHNLVVMRSSVESNIVAVEVKTVLASWHEERHVREMSYYITRCIAKASFLQDFLVEDFGGRDLVIWVLRRRVVIVRLFFVFDLCIPVGIRCILLVLNLLSLLRILYFLFLSLFLFELLLVVLQYLLVDVRHVEAHLA